LEPKTIVPIKLRGKIITLSPDMAFSFLGALILLPYCVDGFFRFTCRTEIFKIGSGASCLALDGSAPQSSAVADEITGWVDGFEDLFLKKYWQKRPVMIRKGLPRIEEYLKCLCKDDMLKLSLDDDVESRLIVRKGQKWNKEYGPFDEETTADLPGNCLMSTRLTVNLIYSDGQITADI
jgi:hypothetical protein